MSGLVALICFVVGQWIATAVFGTLSLIFAGLLYYKNVSLVIAKRLVREPYVVMILVLALCNWIIDIVRPTKLLTPLNGFFYVLIVSTFVFVDAVKVKSRMFVIAIGSYLCWQTFTMFTILSLETGVRASSYSSIPYKRMTIPL